MQNLDELARRPARYWTIDGLPELMVGLLWLVWGGAWLVGETLPHDWRWTAYWLIVPPALALSGVGINWITRRLKERITFPRAGYVQWKEPDRRTALAVGAAIVLAAAVLAAVILTKDRRDLERTVPAVINVVLALSFLAVGVRHRTPHHLALAGAAVVLALAIGAITTGWDAMNWLFVALGTVCIVVGGIRLALFLRAHPLSAAEGL
jgi:peptidoglycan/LPS O-acetylase OafA/YrhL